MDPTCPLGCDEVLELLPPAFLEIQAATVCIYVQSYPGTQPEVRPGVCVDGTISWRILMALTYRWQRDGGLGRWDPRPRDLPVAWGAAGRPSDPRAHQPDGCFPHRGPAGGR